MTPESQNRTICEALGRRWHRPTTEEIESGSYYQYEPDFTRYLDLMHAAEKVLTEDQHAHFRSYLVQNKDYHLGYSATAAQRAEAFLRTIGKWEDS